MSKIQILTFRPAQYYTGKQSYVGYYVLDPLTNKLKRQRIKVSHILNKVDRRRFVRLTFIDSLEYLHSRGKEHNREEVIKKIARCNPVVIVSDELSQTGTNGGQWEINGTTISLSVHD